MSARLPQGFLFSACAAGIKPSGKPDLALALMPEGASAAAVFTRNQIVAAPVLVGRENLRRSQGVLRALIVNAGNANCATGKQGLKSATGVCAGLARQLAVRDHQVFPSSTGIIGVQLPVEKIHAALPELVRAAADTEVALDQYATAIMTTDTHKKVASQTITFKGIEVVLTGVAKGAGMIHPNMATLLVYLFTDLAASPRELQQCLKAAVEHSFNNISIDGDTSTNDTVLLLASGKSGVNFKSVRDEFQAALTKVCRSLAAQIVSDGEGVQHVVRLLIEEARTRKEARQIAQAVATSALTKTAWAGADPNWGRILAAIGYSGISVKPERINIYLGEQQVCRHGAACPFDHHQAHRYMSEPVYDVRIVLGSGNAHLEFLTCDLTAEYVRVNAEYST
ncbi:MAG TPA: bifunctional glutamate N-acetyltransferase/amino-acid acetyltransferase ArgJ [Candidatus Angelobacter sp.]|nr:bifunctional glutamate N-acetyltransferase/amino-acid acetyltransferase ArgJ [Candidatus Angelobacter sp.]